ncbi:MAG TPA: hypothetical protein VI968_04285 [archaeon]|nr:hypothetical protein [archaeon]
MHSDAKIVYVNNSFEMPCTGFRITEPGKDGTILLEYRLKRHIRVLDGASEDGKTTYKGRSFVVSEVTYGGEFGMTFGFSEYLVLGRPKRITCKKLDEYTPCG